MFILIILVILISLFIYQSYFRYFTRTGQLIDKIPGPPGYPLLSNLLDLYKVTAIGWNFIFYLQRKYYPILKGWAFTDYIVIIFHPDDLKILLSDKENINKCTVFYEGIRPRGFEGIFSSFDDKWRARRKMISPTFRSIVLKDYGRKADKHIVSFMRDFCRRGDEFALDVRELFQELSFNIICDAAMGVDVGTLEPGTASDYIKSSEAVLEAAFYFASRPYIPMCIGKYFRVARLGQKGVDRANAIAAKIIRERQEFIKNNNLNSTIDVDENKEENGIDDTEHHKNICFLDQLLECQKKGFIDELGMIEEINVMFNGGYDTVSVALEYALALFAENEKIQDLARTEVIKVMNENGGVIRIEDLLQYHYLRCCIKEVLRLYPSGPIIGRTIDEEIQLKNYTLPRKTQVFIPIMAIQRDPHFWVNPNEFDPSRFFVENSMDRHPFAYIPFSSGPRNCIGQKFGFMELTAVVAHVLYHFCLEPIDQTKDLRLKINHITLRTDDTLRVKFIRIHRT